MCWIVCARWTLSSSASGGRTCRRRTDGPPGMRRVRSARAVRQPDQLDELKAERLDTVEHTVQARLVNVPGQRRVAAVRFDVKITEHLTVCLSQAARDRD